MISLEQGRNAGLPETQVNQPPHKGHLPQVSRSPALAGRIFLASLGLGGGLGAISSVEAADPNCKGGIEITGPNIPFDAVVTFPDGKTYLVSVRNGKGSARWTTESNATVKGKDGYKATVANKQYLNNALPIGEVCGVAAGVKFDNIQTRAGEVYKPKDKTNNSVTASEVTHNTKDLGWLLWIPTVLAAAVLIGRRGRDTVIHGNGVASDHTHVIGPNVTPGTAPVAPATAHTPRPRRWYDPRTWRNH